MLTPIDSRLLSVEGNLRLSGFLTGVLLVASLFPVVCLAQGEVEKTLPKILMVEIQGTPPYDPGLYQAIRAQLSAAPLLLDRIDLADANVITADPLQGASTLAEENGAAMVFWIEDNETCRMFFYLPGPDGGRINSRTLDLNLNSDWSRFQTIAIAAASMVEGLLVTHRLQPITPAPKPPPPIGSSFETNQGETKRKWFEISAAYAGSLFATELVTHGVCLGLGVHPFEHFVLGASFTQNGPLRVETDEYRLTLMSRNVEVSTTGRLLINSLEIRLGVAWTMDLRSISTTFISEKIEAKPDDFKGVHSLLPFVSLAWNFSEIIGIFGRVGAGFALNDTIYKMERIDGDTDEIVPFSAKFSYQLGLLIQI